MFEDLTALEWLNMNGNPGHHSTIDQARPRFLPRRADAGADVTVAAGAAVTLDGSADGGPWGNNVRYEWGQYNASLNQDYLPVVDGDPDYVTLAGADTLTPSFIAPARAATLRFRLTVTGRGRDPNAGGVQDRSTQ